MPKTFYEKVASKYNDKGYQPSSLSLESIEWGPWWISSRILQAPADVKTISAKKAKEKFREMMSRLKLVKENWEKSGNGEDCCMIFECSLSNANENVNKYGTPSTKQ